MRLSIKKFARAERERETDLGALERVDQTALADIREPYDANGHALRRARLVSLEKAHKRRCGTRGEVRALVRACRAEGQRRCRMAEMLQPRLSILARHQVYAYQLT